MKYIVYKGTGGLFHNFRGCERAIQLSIQHDMSLIIDMQCHTGWGRFNDNFTVQSDDLIYYDDYETVPEHVKKFESGSAHKYGYSGRNSNYNIDLVKDVNVVYGTMSSKSFFKNLSLESIKVNEDYFDKIKSNNPPSDEKYIAAHFRNTDRKNNIKQFYDKIHTAVKKHDIHTLYLATDDSEAKIKIQKQFPRLKLIQKANPPSGVKNVHYNHPDAETQMFECVQDLYNIFTSDVFIPCMNSGFSYGTVSMIEQGYTLFPGLISNTIVEC